MSYAGLSPLGGEDSVFFSSVTLMSSAGVWVTGTLVSVSKGAEDSGSGGSDPGAGAGAGALDATPDPEEGPPDMEETSAVAA